VLEGHKAQELRDLMVRKSRTSRLHENQEVAVEWTCQLGQHGPESEKEFTA